MEKPPIKINYPIPMSVMRKLNEGERFSYTGRLLIVSTDNLKKLKRYEQLEERPLFDFSHEFVLLGKVTQRGIGPEKNPVTGDLLEYLYMSGVTATVGLPAKNSWFVETVSYFRRIHLVPVSEVWDSPGIMPSSSVGSYVSSIQLNDIPFYVNVSASGRVYREYCDA